MRRTAVPLLSGGALPVIPFLPRHSPHECVKPSGSRESTKYPENGLTFPHCRHGFVPGGGVAVRGVGSVTKEAAIPPERRDTSIIPFFGCVFLVACAGAMCTNTLRPNRSVCICIATGFDVSGATYLGGGCLGGGCLDEGGVCV